MTAFRRGSASRSDPDVPRIASRLGVSAAHVGAGFAGWPPIIQRAASPHAAASPYQPLAALMPEARTLQFTGEIDAGHFAQAARLYPSLIPAPSRGGTSTPGSFLAERNQRLALPLISAKAAYAYAATGQNDAAHTAMAHAQDQATRAFSTQTTFAIAPLSGLPPYGL